MLGLAQAARPHPAQDELAAELGTDTRAVQRLVDDVHQATVLNFESIVATARPTTCPAATGPPTTRPSPPAPTSGPAGRGPRPLLERAAENRRAAPTPA
jgi:hypothetical protein